MDLNIRNVPEEVMRSLRVDAAAENTTIRELCLKRLAPDGGAGWKPRTVQGEPIKEPAKRVKKEKASPPVEIDPMIATLELAASGVEDEPEIKPTPAKLAPCPRCKGTTIQWGSMRRCERCKQNY